MMTIGIDIATGPDRTAWAVRAAGSTNWQFHYDAAEFERAHGFSPFVRMVSRAELEAFEYRTPEHQSAVEAKVQDRLRIHADRQGPCVTAEEATDPAVGMRAYFRAARHWQILGFDECSRFVAGPLPSERLAKRMGLGPKGYPVPAALRPRFPTNVPDSPQ